MISTPRTREVSLALITDLLLVGASIALLLFPIEHVEGLIAGQVVYTHNIWAIDRYGPTTTVVLLGSSLLLGAALLAGALMHTRRNARFGQVVVIAAALLLAVASLGLDALANPLFIPVVVSSIITAILSIRTRVR